MRILFVSDAWRPQVNGVVRTIEATAQELERRGHSVEVIGPDRFRTVPLPTYPGILLALLPGDRLARMMEEFAPDAIHIATEGPLGWAARNWCLHRNRVFTTAYHTRFPEYLAARGIPQGFGYAVLRRFHAPSGAVMAATDALRSELLAKGFTKVSLWTRGVDTDRFRPLEQGPSTLRPAQLAKPVLLYAGRVAIEKNLRAFLDLDTPGSKVVVGDGPQLRELQRAYPAVCFTGALEGDDLVRAYSAADVFVFPSRTDTFGLVLAEALACGIPVAAFAVQGPANVLAPQDLQAPVACLDDDLGAAIRRCLALQIPPARCRAFAKRHYSWERATDQFLDTAAPICDDGRADDVRDTHKIGRPAAAPASKE